MNHQSKLLTLQNRLEGGIVGLLVGDALGVPYEFHNAAEIPDISELEFEPPPLFHRSYSGIPAGTWSDDGALALCLLASLLNCDRLDVDDLGRRMLDWYKKGYKSVDAYTFDVGNQTRSAILKIAAGIPALEAASRSVHANGNGSLMRALPLALWHKGSDAALVADAHLQSVVTHAHIRSQVCCALYTLWARYTLNGHADAWKSAVIALRSIYKPDSEERDELELEIIPDAPPGGDGSGYVVDCLHSARWAVEAGSFEQVVKAAISIGNDTDTTACVAGGIAGVRDGIDAIPFRWREKLRGKELYSDDLQRLITWRCYSD